MASKGEHLEAADEVAAQTNSYDLSHLSIGSIASPQRKKQFFETNMENAGHQLSIGNICAQDAFASPNFVEKQQQISVIESLAASPGQAEQKGVPQVLIGSSEFQTDLYLWGKNHFGQLGIPQVESEDAEQVTQADLQKRLDPQHYVAPVVAALDMPIVQVACGEEHTAILTEKGLVYTMGSNASGQVGVKVLKKPQTEASASTLGSFRAESARSLSSQASKQVKKQIANQNKYFQPIPIPITNGNDCRIVKIACGEQHTLALTKRGQVFSWGQARFGALGLDFNLMSQKPNSTSNCLRQNRTIENQYQMYSMGGKSAGISSKEDAFQSLNFKGIDVSYVDTPTLITQFENEIVFEISAGSKHSVFATLADKVFACGSGLQGQLGLGAFVKQQAREHQEKPGDEPSPDENGEAAESAHMTDLRLLQHMFVPDTRLKMFDHVKIKQIACGRYHTLFLTQEGEVYSCGQNTLGQLGIGRQRENPTVKSSADARVDLKNCIYIPQKVSGALEKKKITQVSAWANSACVSVDHQLYMWGSDVFGDFEEPRHIDLAKLIQRDEPIDVKKVCLGGSFTLIQDLELNIYCWGSEYFKEVKTNKESKRLVKIPRKVLHADDKVKDFAVGGYFAISFQKYRKATEAAAPTPPRRHQEPASASPQEPMANKSTPDERERPVNERSPEPEKLVFEQSFGSSPRPCDLKSSASQSKHASGNTSAIQLVHGMRLQNQLNNQRANMKATQKPNNRIPQLNKKTRQGKSMDAKKNKINKDVLIQSLMHQLEKYKDYEKLKEQMLEYQKENYQLKQQIQEMQERATAVPGGQPGAAMFIQEQAAIGESNQQSNGSLPARNLNLQSHSSLSKIYEGGEGLNSSLGHITQARVSNHSQLSGHTFTTQMFASFPCKENLLDRMEMPQQHSLEVRPTQNGQAYTTTSEPQIMNLNASGNPYPQYNQHSQKSLAIPDAHQALEAESIPNMNSIQIVDPVFDKTLHSIQQTLNKYKKKRDELSLSQSFHEQERAKPLNQSLQTTPYEPRLTTPALVLEQPTQALPSQSSMSYIQPPQQIPLLNPLPSSRKDTAQISNSKQKWMDSRDFSYQSSLKHQPPVDHAASASASGAHSTPNLFYTGQPNNQIPLSIPQKPSQAYLEKEQKLAEQDDEYMRTMKQIYGEKHYQETKEVEEEAKKQKIDYGPTRLQTEPDMAYPSARAAESLDSRRQEIMGRVNGIMKSYGVDFRGRRNQEEPANMPVREPTASEYQETGPGLGQSQPQFQKSNDQNSIVKKLNFDNAVPSTQIPPEIFLKEKKSVRFQESPELTAADKLAQFVQQAEKLQALSNRS